MGFYPTALPTPIEEARTRGCPGSVPQLVWACGSHSRRSVSIPSISAGTRHWLPRCFPVLVSFSSCVVSSPAHDLRLGRQTSRQALWCNRILHPPRHRPLQCRKGWTFYNAQRNHQEHHAKIQGQNRGLHQPQEGDYLLLEVGIPEGIGQGQEFAGRGLLSCGHSDHPGSCIDHLFYHRSQG